MDDVIVVGAGIIGLAVALHLVTAGVRTTVIDSDPEGDKTSVGNAGGIAVTEVVPASVPGVLWRVPGWLMDPLGPLAVRPAHVPRLLPWLWQFAKAGRAEEVSRIAAALAALNAHVPADLSAMLKQIGMRGELHQNGALTLYESEAGFQRDGGEWALKRRHGIEVIELDGDAARSLEPALGPLVRRAVMTPRWAQVDDPKVILDGMRCWAQANGVRILSGRVVNAAPTSRDVSVGLEGGGSVHSEGLVIAAGAWSGLLAKALGDHVLVESERGYNTTFAQPGISLSRELVFAERKIVATHLRCGLRIGGAAEFGGLDATPDYRRCRSLVKMAAAYLPGLRTEGGTNWAGHRSSTPDSLPVIGRSPRSSRVFYAFGHGHLGLTHAATTGRLIAELVQGRPSTIDLVPYSIARFNRS